LLKLTWEKVYALVYLGTVMPRILDAPMKKTESISITSEQAYAKFTARKAHIEINSIRNKGIKINSRYKSEQSSIGVNDNYLASVTYRKRTFPIYIIAFVVFLLLGITFSLGSGNTDPEFETDTDESDNSGDAAVEIATYVFYLLSGVSLFLYFYTRIARISFRLADEQDYDILLSSSAVQDSELMQKFIEKILMNAMNVEEEITPISLEQTVVIQQPQQAMQQPQPAIQQPQPAVQQPQPALMQQPQPAVMQQPQQAMQQPYQQPPQP